MTEQPRVKRAATAPVGTDTGQITFVGTATTLIQVAGFTILTDPAEVGAVGESVSDRKYKMMAMLDPDPAKHVRQIKAMQAMGATAVVVMNVSGADPLGTVSLYGEHVLPQLRS